MSVFSYSDWVLYGAICSILGWVCETIWCSILQKRLVNRGFFFGPWCPIYGVGAAVILLLAFPFRKSAVLVFLIAMLAATALEYFAGWMLEALFKTRWWDYSENRFNLKGRVCLENSLLFGLMGIVSVYGLYPFLEDTFEKISASMQAFLAAVIVVVFIMDLIRSLSAAGQLGVRMEGLRSAVDELKALQDSHQWFDKQDLRGSVQHLRTLCAEQPDKAELVAALDRIDVVFSRERGSQRLLRAFPNLLVKDFGAELEVLKQEWLERQKKAEGVTVKLKRRMHAIKQEILASYEGFSVTHVIWLFFIGCIAGYIVETAFCFVKNGYFESRQGMIYGPFSQIYGFGAVIIALVLTPLAKKGELWIFVGGGLIGGAYEALCSIIQEAMLGTTSWEYSGHSFSLFGGRTSLLYMVFWGALAVIYMKRIYPHVCKMIEQIPKRPKHTLSIIIAVLISADMLISGLAVARWAERDAGVAANNAVEVWLDEAYPDEMLEEIYPNMNFVS